jgi:hypothetical protein
VFLAAGEEPERAAVPPDMSARAVDLLQRVALAEEQDALVAIEEKTEFENAIWIGAQALGKRK